MGKNKTKPTSFRPRGELLEKIDSVCDKLDCSRNDYINSALESALSEDIEENSPGPDRNTIQSNKRVEILIEKEPGKLYLQSTNRFFGNSSDYEFDETEVYDKKGNLVGRRIYVKAI